MLVQLEVAGEWEKEALSASFTTWSGIEGRKENTSVVQGLAEVVASSIMSEMPWVPRVKPVDTSEKGLVIKETV